MPLEKEPGERAISYHNSLWDPSGIPLGYLWDPSGISSIYSMLYSIVTSTSVCECAGARALIVT